jgi:hypothetical protein
MLLLVAPPRPAPPQRPGTLTVGELSLQIQDSGWITHDHVDPQIGRSIMDYVPDVQQGVSAINYNAAPLAPRNKGDLSQVFNSAVNGDPSTPVFRAYPGDPVRFRAAMPFGTNVHNFALDGHAWPWEPLMSGSQILSNRTFMSGEFIDARLAGGAGGTLHTPGDHFYGDARGPYTRAGLWGILRVFASTQPDLVPLQAEQFSGGPPRPRRGGLHPFA